MGEAMINRDFQHSCYSKMRTEIYLLLASFLAKPPGTALRDLLKGLEWDDAAPANLAGPLASLRATCRATSIEAMQAEFNTLFVGLGSGEIVPYASWYREKKIQSRPLADLRTDLYRLGIIRTGSDHEPEDSAAALCEVMAIISGGHGLRPLVTQSEIFRNHLAGWMGIFFQDLAEAKSALFYRTVGQTGLRFMESEGLYLECDLNFTPIMKRRNGYEKGICRQSARLP
jgi:TorA maturation chaperone TorD